MKRRFWCVDVINKGIVNIKLIRWRQRVRWSGSGGVAGGCGDKEGEVAVVSLPLRDFDKALNYFVFIPFPPPFIDSTTYFY
jgi:hypothetical protein